MALTLQKQSKHIKFFNLLFFSFVLLFNAKSSFALALNLKDNKNSKVTKERILYGKTKSGQELYAIRVYKKEHKLPMRPAVIITGGIHGNEHMGIVSGMAELITENDEGFKDFFASGGVAYFFPELNPTGVSSRNRYNPSGFDLNRDFKIGRTPSQSESSQMLNFLENDLDNFGARPILAMDYHCCAKSLIYPQIGNKDTFYKGQFEKIAALMREHVDPEYKTGITKDIFGYETEGTLKGFWFKKYGALSFTYEGGNPTEEAKKLAGHHAWWKKIMGVVVDIYDNKLAMLKPQLEQREMAGEGPALYTE